MIVGSRLRRFMLTVMSWAIVVPLAVLIPTGSASADVSAALDWASYDALFMPKMERRIAGPSTVAGVSRFGIDPVAPAGRIAAAFEHSPPMQRTEPCDANQDGEATGTWEPDQSNGDDNLAALYLENREDEPGYVRPLRRTEPGYRTNVWVCTEFVDLVAEKWIDRRDPISADEERETVLADEAVDWYEAAAEQARKQVSNTLYEPGWQIWPAHRSRQIVGLPSWLYITDEAWEYHPSSTAHEGEVTVQAAARPVSSVWRFGDGEIVACTDRGEPWSSGASHPPPCGREWEHTHDGIDLEVGLVYEVEWISSLSSATVDLSNVAIVAEGTSPVAADGWRSSANKGHSFMGAGRVDGPFREAVELRVGEVQTYGSTIGAREQLPPPESEPIIGKLHEPCGGFWGSVRCKFSSAIQILDKALTFLIPGFEEIKKFARNCAQGVAAFVEDFVQQIKDVAEVIKNPFKAASDAWDALKAMRTAISEDAQGFVNDFIGETLREEAELERLDGPDGVVGWVGFILCKKGIEWVVEILKAAAGAAASTFGLKLLDFMKKFKGRSNDRGDSGNDGDNNNRDDENNDDENNDDEENNRDCGCRGGTCRISNSFPAGTRVLMADGAHKPIELIRPGDHVISYNLDTSVWEPKLVVDQWSHPDRGPPATATLVDGSTVTATADHRFWVTTTETWIELRHVQPGDGLLTPDGVVGVDHVTVGPAHPWIVWELTVTDNHNFTVTAGTSDLLVHNQGNGECDEDDQNPDEQPQDDSNKSERNRQKKAELEQKAAAERERLAANGETVRNDANVATSELDLDGGDLIETTGISGQQDRSGTAPQVGDDPVFDMDPDRPRPTDSERKILEELASQLGEPDPLNPITGTLDIFSERVPCSSCGGIIDQFRDRYPGIEVNVYSGDA